MACPSRARAAAGATGGTVAAEPLATGGIGCGGFSSRTGMAADNRVADLPIAVAVTAAGRAGPADAGRATPAPERRGEDGASAEVAERDPDDGEGDDEDGDDAEVSAESAEAGAAAARPMTTPAPRAAARAPTRPTKAAVTARIISGYRRLIGSSRAVVGFGIPTARRYVRARPNQPSESGSCALPTGPAASRRVPTALFLRTGCCVR